jgi:hypothetical protein
MLSSFQPLDQRTLLFRGTAFQPQYGTAVASRTLWVGGGVNVLVDALRNPVPPRRINPFLRSYLPVPAQGGHVITKWGMPAATQTLACSDPSGPCPGFVGGLVVLDGDHTIYDVYTHQPDRASVEGVLDSLRVPAADESAG